MKAAEEQAGDAISFGTYLGTAGTTRAGKTGAITSTSDLQTANFGVFAYQHGNTAWGSITSETNKKANFMYNQLVTYSAPNWTYTPVKYWPNGTDTANPADSPSNTATEGGTQYLSFFAYAPYVYVGTSESGKLGNEKITTTDETHEALATGESQGTGSSKDVGITNLTANNATGNPVVTYKLPATPVLSGSVDLLWGLAGKATYQETDNSNASKTVSTSYNTDLTKQIVSEDVKFRFHHALAQIENIKVVYDIDGNGQGAQGYGTTDNNTLVTINSVSIKAADATTVYQDGTFDISTGTWTAGSTKYTAETSLISGEEINAAVKEATPKNDGTTGWKNSSDAAFEGVTVVAKDLYSTYSPIMFIPVPSNQPVLKVAVQYTVRTYDANLDATTASGETNNGKWTKVTQTITNNVTLPQLAVNKKYTLVMHLGLTSVKFSADISDWEDGETEEVWLPSNVVGESTSLSIAAGKSATVNTAAGTTSYTINLTGLNSNSNTNTLEVTATPATTCTPTYSASQETGSVAVTLTANESTTETKTTTVVIKEKTSGGEYTGKTTIVTIIQAKATS